MRELNKNLFPKPKEELKVSLYEWQEVKKTLLELKNRLRQEEGGTIFVHSKMVKLFDELQKHIEQIKSAQKLLENSVQKHLSQMREDLEEFKNIKEEAISEQVKNLIDRHQKINDKHSHQLQDLSHNLTLQSEQMWSLTDQLQEIKEEISSKENQL